jgi:hypothetical protein
MEMSQPCANSKVRLQDRSLATSGAYLLSPYISPGSPNQRLGWLGLVENETISRQSPAFTIDEATPPNIYHMQESRYYTN